MADAVVRLMLKPKCYTHNTDSSPASNEFNASGALNSVESYPVSGSATGLV